MTTPDRPRQAGGSILDLSGFRPDRFPRAAPVAPRASRAPPVRAGASYARFSTRAQRLDSLQRQYETCRAQAASIGVPIRLELGDPACSGLSTERPGLRRLLAEAELGHFSHLFVENLDRLSREGLPTRSLCRRLFRLGIKIYDCAKGEVDAMMLAFGADAAEDDREGILMRARAGAATALAEGRVLGKCAYGYARHRAQPGVHVPHPERAPIVREIFERCDAGETAGAIAAILPGPSPGDCQRLDGRKARKGAAWTAGMVKAILRNPIYKGLLVDGRTTAVKDPSSKKRIGQTRLAPELWRVYEVPALGLVDVRTWDRVQPRVATLRSNDLHRDGQSPRLTTGRLHCGLCSSPVEGVRGHGSADVMACSGAGCPGVGRPQVDNLERAFLAMLADWLDEVLADRREAVDHETDVRRRYRDELDRIGAELQRGVAAAASSKRTVSALEKQRRDDLSKRAAAIRVFLDPTRDLADPLDATDLRRRVGVALETVDERLRSGRGSLMAAARTLVSGATVHPKGDILTLRLDIDPRRIGHDRDLLETRSVDVAIDTLTDHSSRDAAREAGRSAVIAELALHPGRRLPAAVSDRLSSALPDLSARLGATGWTLPAMVEASAFRARTGCDFDKLPPCFGPLETIAEAGRIIGSSGARGAIAAILKEAGVRFEGAHRTFFVSRLEPGIELAMAPEAIAALREVASSDPRCATLADVAFWLERSARSGRVSRWGSNDARLTTALVILGRAGLDGLLYAPPGCLPIPGEPLRADSEAVRAHLLGESCVSIARRTKCTDRGVRRLVSYFRARAGASIATAAPRPATRRLSEEEFTSIEEWLQGGVDPDDANHCLTSSVLVRLCRERFGVSVNARSLMTCLRDRGNATFPDGVCFSQAAETALACVDIGFVDQPTC